LCVLFASKSHFIIRLTTCNFVDVILRNDDDDDDDDDDDN